MSISYGQVERHQTIRGKVIDAVTGYALIGADVILLESDPVIGTSTDLNGSFILENIPLGRQGIEIRYVGYSSRVIPNLFLSSGKEVQVEVKLEENAMDMEEVVVRYTKRKDKALNEMALVSSRDETESIS